MEGCTQEQAGQKYQERQQLTRNNPRNRAGVQGDNRLRNQQNRYGETVGGTPHHSTLKPYAADYQPGILRQ